MKKISLCITLVLSVLFQSGAQNIYDAMTVSENQYFGTARTMGLGNAVTALGGEIGMMGINPAGGAVAGYSQVEITPGLNISSVMSSYCPSYGGSSDAAQNTVGTRFTMPSLGANFRFNLGRTSGLRNLNLTLAFNSTNFFTSGMNSTGINSHTSKFAEFAVAGEGVATSTMTYSGQRNMWDVVNAYEAGTISAVTYQSYMGASEYLSADETYHYIPGELNQNNAAYKNGYKSDFLFGLSGNISDKFYFGINIGMPVINIDYTQSYRETAVDQKQFPAAFVDEKGQKTTTYFNSALYEYNFVSRANGVYAKLGFLAVPLDFLRIGIAVSTPTNYVVNESWQYSGSVSYADSKFSTSRTSSPVASTQHTIRGAWEVNAGVAMVAGQLGLLSVDYEMTDYSCMCYTGNNSFEHVNTQISYFCGQSHNVRVGLEFRATDELSLRAGWTVMTCPEKYYIDEQGVKVNPVQFEKRYKEYTGGTIKLGPAMYYNNNTFSYSLGAGYSLDNGLYFDLAARMTTYPSYEYYPYYDYKNYDKTGKAVNVKSPVISCTRKLWNVALTLGWRF